MENNISRDTVPYNWFHVPDVINSFDAGSASDDDGAPKLHRGVGSRPGAKPFSKKIGPWSKQ
jgi:hypothetical protein